jgi:hypothetical protein
MNSWTHATSELTIETLQDIIDGNTAAIRIPAFASVDECKDMCAAAKTADVERRDASTSPMQLIGANFSNHHGATKQEYFALARAAARDLGTITRASFDPVTRVIEALRRAWPGSVQVAEEDSDGTRYFAGCIKSRSQNSAVHFDYVPLLAPDYRIGAIREQLAWNVYLAMPQDSGETTLYAKPVPHKRSPSTVPGKLNFIDPEFVRDAPSFTFRPMVGELAIFNSRFPHQISVSVDSPSDQRMQIGGFAGVMPNGELVLWS